MKLWLCYRKDKINEEEKKNTFVGNPYYKKQEFKDQYKQALFELLTQYYKTFKENKYKLVVPDQVRKKTNVNVLERRRD